MCFEVRERDLLARTGVIETKSGRFETPALLPVVNPAIQVVSPRELYERFGFKAIITNAYIIMRRYGREAVEKGVHALLDFPGVVATDSGAYQLLVYGRVEVGPEEVVAYQEDMGSDIATILDVPTGWEATREEAIRTVLVTFERGRELWSIRRRDDILWVGPVQGGRFTDLVARSAELMGELPFHIHALGSPVPVMEAYRFDVLVDMIMAAKLNLPPERPLHLFGAGHPMMFSLAVALGCDTFDSAAYAIYARDGRYMTESGTARLEELAYFPCDCPVCVKHEPSELLEMPEHERTRLLAMHNLYACARELRAIRQAIREGRLWDHLMQRAHAHPSLLRAVRKLASYADVLEENAPVARKKGIFIFSSADLARPELVRYEKRLLERFRPGPADLLLLLPYPPEKPFSRSPYYANLLSALTRLGPSAKRVQVCLYNTPFGIVPLELDQVHPLSQYEFAGPDEGVMRWATRLVEVFVRSKPFKAVLLLSDGSELAREIAQALKAACDERTRPLLVLEEEDPWSAEALAKALAKLVELAGTRDPSKLFTRSRE